MMRIWLDDAADRLEAAAEIARELVTSSSVTHEPILLRINFLAERLWQAAQRLGILPSLGTSSGAQVVHAVGDLDRIARRAGHLARAEGYGALSEGLGTIASELQAILVELRALGATDPHAPSRDGSYR